MNSSSPRPTIRTLARMLHVSPTTVSEALRNHPRVNAQTRERVQEAARSLGYRFNPLASSIMSEVRRTGLSTFHGVLAAINLVEPARPFFPGPYLRDLLRGAGERASELGFKLERFNVGRRGLTLPRLDTILQARGIRGVLLCPAWNHPDFAQLSWTNYTGVYADYLIERPALHSVCPDHHRAMISVLTHLHELGYRRPGLVLQKQQNERLQYRWAAPFLAYGQFREGFTPVAPLIVPEISRSEFVGWFRDERPDVVLGHRAEIVEWMTSVGARVPETHGFCCLNVGLNMESCAGIDLQPYHIGARGIELVIAQIHRNAYGIPEVPCNTAVPARWIDGPTLRAASAAEAQSTTASRGPLTA